MLQSPIVHHPFSYPIGPIELTGFGLAVLLAFVIAQIIAERELVRRGHAAEPIGDLIFAAVIGGLLGAKIYYAILTGDPRDLFHRAGFVFWGGLIGGIALVSAVVMKKRLGFWRITDVGAICVAAAYSVGRSGCWAVGDDYGTPWQSRWAVAFPQGAPPSTAENLRVLFGAHIPADVPAGAVLSVYPTQIWEVLLGFLMFLILWRLRDHKHAEGWLAGVYCVLAGAERFFIEFFRAKDDRFFGWMTTAQLIALVFIALGIAIMAARSTPGPGKSGIYSGVAVPRPA